MKVCIMTPDRVFVDVEAEELIVPTNTGQIGILPGHTPLLASLDIGVLFLRQTSRWVPMALMGGFALVQKNTITLLVNEVEAATDIDAEEAKKGVEETAANFASAKGEKEKLEADLKYRRAKARLQATQENAFPL